MYSGHFIILKFAVSINNRTRQNRHGTLAGNISLHNSGNSCFFPG